MAYRLVIGLDFGTTYTGVAYADTSEADANDPGKVILVTEWPGKTESNREKVPSIISYDEKDAISWGYKFNRSANTQKVYAGLKLKLDPSQEDAHVRDILRMIAGIDLDSDLFSGKTEDHGRTVLDIISDYLTQVREFAIENIKSNYDEYTWSKLRKELVITVPAVWSEKARDLTRKAVARANFQVDSTSMIAEPEAAALFVLKSKTKGVGKANIQPGDCFIITDCGGGTVDLVSYKILSTNPYTMVEAAVGSGEKCGSVFVQNNFFTWLEKWIGTEIFQKIPESDKSHKSILVRNFQDCVYSFDGTDDIREIPLPDECGIENDSGLGIRRRKLNLTTDRMESFFQHSLQGTLALIDKQIEQIQETHNQKPKMVFVVGGFGKNPYLYKQISAHCQNKGIETRRPAEAWEAIVKGAVCRGLEDPNGALVANRLARKHYGTPCSVKFIEGVHDEDDATINEYTGIKMASNQIDWMVAKGAELPVHEPKTFSLLLNAHFKKDEERTVSSTLIGSYDEVPSKKFLSKGTKIILQVDIDISDIPLSDFNERKNEKGEIYYHTYLTMKATFDGLDIIWTVYCGGKEYGRSIVRYDA